MPITQTDRHVSLTTPLGEDALLLVSLHHAEQLGRPFQMELSLLSEDWNVAFDQVVGQNVTVRLDLPDGAEPRFFNGFVSRFVQAGGTRLAAYHMTVVPWLWFLTRVSDCRIFQNKTIPDIIKEVFRDRGFTDFEESLSDNYEPLE